MQENKHKTNELCELFGVSSQTLRVYARELFGGDDYACQCSGISRTFTEQQAYKIFVYRALARSLGKSKSLEFVNRHCQKVPYWVEGKEPIEVVSDTISGSYISVFVNLDRIENDYLQEGINARK